MTDHKTGTREEWLAARLAQTSLAMTKGAVETMTLTLANELGSEESR